MQDGRITKDLLYGGLAHGKRKTGRPYLRFKDVCKRDMKSTHIDTDDWEKLSADQNIWRQTVLNGTKLAEQERRDRHEDRRRKRRDIPT